jgi:signal transduction histidine kinase
MRKAIVCIAMMFSISAFSQKLGLALLDSLKLDLYNTRDDGSKAKLYLRIADVYIDIDLRKAGLYADSGSFISNKINWKEGIANSYVTNGNIYNFRGDYNKAVASIKKGYTLYSELGDKKQVGRTIYTLGMSYERLSNYEEAIRCGFQSLRIFENIPGCERESGNSLSMIAVIYFLQKDFKKSIEYSLLALKKQESAKNTIGVANELSEMADTYHELHDSANAVRNNLRALEIYNKIGDKFGEALVNYQLGRVYARNYDTALAYLFAAEKLFNKLSDSSNTSATNMGEIGRILLRMVKQNDTVPSTRTGMHLPNTRPGMLQLAGNYLQKAVTISRLSGDREDEVAFSADLAEVQSLRGDYKNAYYNFRKYQEVTDSIFSQENKNKIAAIESQRAIDLKNKEIENKELQIGNQQKGMWLLIICLAFVLTIGAVLYYQSISRKKTNRALHQLNNELDEANRVKAKFFGILGHDLRSPVANLINFMQLQKRKPGAMNLEQVADRETRITESAKSLLETMETMLLWSKGQMEHFKPDISEIRVKDLFAYIQRFFTGSEYIKFTFLSEKDLVVQTDENYLQTIMRNLTANASKALQVMPGAAIEWKAWEEENNVYLSISDNGPGVSSQQVKALYDETASSGAKTGLGLHIIRDLTKAIGCVITLNSQKKEGTEFVLCLAKIGK